MPATLARWIMRRATANPPRGREDWARAMQAEFDALTAGRLSWALGCWTTMAGWRLQADWGFYLLLALSPLIAEVLAPLLSVAGSRVIPGDVFRPVFPALVFAAPLLASAALAAWRPGQWATAALVLATGAIAIPAAIQILVLGAGAWSWFGAPPLVGWAITLAACGLAAAVAAGLRLSSRRLFKPA